MPLAKSTASYPFPYLSVDGFIKHDWTILNPCQRECTSRLEMTIQLEHETYLSQHPEFSTMLQIYLSKIKDCSGRKDHLKDIVKHFTRPAKVLDKEIRERLRIKSDELYTKSDKQQFLYEDQDLEIDIRALLDTHFPEVPRKMPTPDVRTPTTASSSFLSVRTSETTLPTPEPIPTPEATLSDIMFNMISNTVDKAIFVGVDDYVLHYDTAYVEISKAVEEAMEMTVIEIKEDFAELYFKAYEIFEYNIKEKERIAAEITWEKRMRKKLKLTLRRLTNFKGYETPPTPKSEISSHESYRMPPPRPCSCHPQWHFDRYPKDRFGIYVPRDVKYSENNVTATPAISVTSLQEEVNEVNYDTNSNKSKKTVTSNKSAVKK